MRAGGRGRLVVPAAVALMLAGCAPVGPPPSPAAAAVPASACHDYAMQQALAGAASEGKARGKTREYTATVWQGYAGSGAAPTGKPLVVCQLQHAHGAMLGTALRTAIDARGRGMAANPPSGAIVPLSSYVDPATQQICFVVADTSLAKLRTRYCRVPIGIWALAE